MSASTVLYDAPGPVTRRRQLFYSIVFLLAVAALVVWVVLKLKTAGEFDQRIFDGLSQSNVWTAIWQGLQKTLMAAAISIVLAVLLGFALAIGRLSDHRWISRPCWAVIEFFRAVPVLLMMIFLNRITGGHGLDLELRGLISVVGGLTLYNGSVLAEVFRSGVQAVPKGQAEAAYAIGMRKGQVMRIVQMPQAISYMLPAIISQCVVALKDTSLGYIVLYPELTRQGRGISLYLSDYLMVFGLVALIYVVMNNLVSALATWLERRLARRGRTSTRAMEDVEAALPQG